MLYSQLTKITLVDYSLLISQISVGEDHTNSASAQSTKILRGRS